jgi:hypothetical protein
LYGDEGVADYIELEKFELIRKEMLESFEQFQFSGPLGNLKVEFKQPDTLSPWSKQGQVML